MNIIYCFWTGENDMSYARQLCLNQLMKVSECEVKLINKDNLPRYILPEHPLHVAYQYLSETHKADYLRTYFMNFYGGGYSDIKKTTGSWIKSFNILRNSPDKWICGYKEIGPNGVPFESLADKWEELVGNGAYICKPQTPFTEEWYSNMISLMDKKLELLKENPATYPQDKAEEGNGYPIRWSEMLGEIFHQVCYKYKEHVLNMLPISIFYGYR
jgi:hypothetical protein